MAADDIRKATADPELTSASGAVRGTRLVGGIAGFKGIPYAEPPVGALRFQPPQRRAPWAGVRDATEYGSTAPQKMSAGGASELIPNAIVPGDDYLNLNIWTPDAAASLPVMVFIHGGSWAIGSGAVPGYDGANFARDGVVLVTINYRLGIEGFVWFGEGAPNLGMLDQVCALEWVRDNIASFGGDPERVTVFGESAGGMSVGTLLAMPAAQGLFVRAIAQSGGAYHAIDAASAKLVANRIADIVGVAHSREALAGVPMDRLLDAQLQIAKEVSKHRKRFGDAGANGLAFEPVIDGTSLPSLPIDAIRRGAAEGIEVLIGNNAEEGLFLFAPTGVVKKTRRWLLPFAARRVGLPAFEAVRVYTASRPDARPGDLLSDMFGDAIDAIPTIRVAEGHPGTHVYEFAWRSPAFDGELGACHGIELPFVFDNVGSPDWAALTLGAGPQSVADVVHQAWVDFAKTGDPGWRPYSTADRAVMRFDVESAVVVDPRASIRKLWEGRR
jgi:para-nitrobenzyl esterase